MDQQQRQLMGKRIKTRREALSLSQDMLAEKLNMKRTNIANYEAGRVIPPGNVIKELSDILGISSDFLLGRIDNPDMRIVESKNLSKEEVTLLKNIPIIANKEMSDNFISEHLISELRKVNLYDMLEVLSKDKNVSIQDLINSQLGKRPQLLPITLDDFKQVNLLELIEYHKDKGIDSFIGQFILDFSNNNDSTKVGIRINEPQLQSSSTNQEVHDKNIDNGEVDDDIQLIARGMQKLKEEKPEDFDAIKTILKSMSKKADEELNK
jgi:transcriptional regulator with XRE-family HTH domain